MASAASEITNDIRNSIRYPAASGQKLNSRLLPMEKASDSAFVTRFVRPAARSRFSLVV